MAFQLTSISTEDFLGIRRPVRIISLLWACNQQSVLVFEDVLGDHARNLINRRIKIPQLVQGENPVDDHVCFGANKRGHHQTRTIAQKQSRLQKERLEMLRFSRRGRHRGFLLLQKGIDGGAFTHIGVAHQADAGDFLAGDLEGFEVLDEFGTCQDLGRVSLVFFYCNGLLCNIFCF
jgi:hypothetical protein